VPASLSVPGRAVRALVVSRGAWRRCEDHLAAHLPDEAVGLFAGRVRTTPAGPVGVATRFLPLPNRAARPSRVFEVPASDLLRAMAYASAQGLTALAVVHSHPDGPARPSRPDTEGGWPELVTVVVGRSGTARRAVAAPAPSAGQTVPIAVGRRRGQGAPRPRGR